MKRKVNFKLSLLERIKCEKKQNDFVDKKRLIRDDSVSCSSRDKDQERLPTRQRQKSNGTSHNHKWRHFFRSRSSANTPWEQSLRNHRRSIDVVWSASDLGSLSADKYNNDCNITEYEYKTENAEEKYDDNIIESETYWKNKVLRKFSADQRDLLGETLFFHIWNTKGESTAADLVKSCEPNQLTSKAQSHFDNACKLWKGDKYDAAHGEFERSRRIREVQSPQKSLLQVQYKRTSDESDTKRMDENAELFFAMGMTQSAKRNHYAALKEFRRAFQISALGLGMLHDLAKASLHMIRSTCLAMGHRSYEIQHSVSLLIKDIEHEIAADKLCAKGVKGRALSVYANLQLLYDSDSMVQARIMSKMARIFEENEQYEQSLELWTEILVLYNENPSLGTDHPMARHALCKIVEARKQIQLK